ncbi:MAG TPA: hypothetical protein VN777_14125 [Terriglobales bacterium]|jgi:hypothetical protein|nr:hypothetical protein [Terriglobales bacterium]
MILWNQYALIPGMFASWFAEDIGQRQKLVTNCNVTRRSANGDLLLSGMSKQDALDEALLRFRVYPLQQKEEHLLCKLDRAFQLLYSFRHAFGVFNNFGESASRSK